MMVHPSWSDCHVQHGWCFMVDSVHAYSPTNTMAEHVVLVEVVCFLVLACEACVLQLYPPSLLLVELPYVETHFHMIMYISRAT